MDAIVSGESEGFWAFNMAATPETTGAAMLVPSQAWYFPLSTVLNIFTPGEEISTEFP